MPRPLDRPVVCPALIGRDVQLNALLHLFAATTTGHGRTAVLAGEAGIGKSRLVATFVERLTAGSPRAGQGTVRVLSGRCFEPDRTLPFAPLVDLLRNFFGACSASEAATYARLGGPLLPRPPPKLAP